MAKYIDKEIIRELLFSYFDCVHQVTYNSDYYESNFDETLTPYDVVDMITDCVNRAPSADAVEVVRCKDCKNFEHGYCNKLDYTVLAHDYCSYGERKG